MQYTPNQLKEKLLKALDKDNNVVDMSGVLEVISVLEKYPITREALEQTRIGKHINEMRKKTSSKELSKRAKNLVRKWQQLFTSPTASSSGGTVNGEGISGTSGSASSLPAYLSQSGGGGSKPASPALKMTGSPKPIGSRPSTPSSSIASQSLPSKSRPDTPSSNHSRPSTPSNLHQSRLSPKASLVNRQGHSRINDLAKTKPTSPAAVTCVRVNSPSLPKPLYTSTPTIPKAGCNVALDGRESVSKSSKRKKNHSSKDTDLPVKRLVLDECSSDSALTSRLTADTVRLKDGRDLLVNGQLPSTLGNGDSSRNSPISHEGRKIAMSGTNAHMGRQKASSQNNGSSFSASTSPATTESRSSFAARKNTSLTVKTEPDRTKDRLPPKTPRVKTTAQLIEELRAKNSALSNSETIAKITKNQIEQEPDLPDESVVPAGAKPRPRRKPGSVLTPPGTSNTSLSQVKSEMVQKFLQTSVTPGSSDMELSSPFKLEPGIQTESPVLMDGGAQMESLSNVDSVGSFHSNSSLNILKVDDYNVESRDVDGSLQDEHSRHSAIPSTSHANVDTTETDPLEDPWSMLPQLNLDEICWDDDTYPEPEIPPATEETIHRLHNEHWPGVNGYFDYMNEWTDWTRTYSMPSYNGDLLHILPYVNIDD